jgi:hypothetical protein
MSTDFGPVARAAPARRVESDPAENAWLGWRIVQFTDVIETAARGFERFGAARPDRRTGVVNDRRDPDVARCRRTAGLRDSTTDLRWCSALLGIEALVAADLIRIVAVTPTFGSLPCSA